VRDFLGAVLAREGALVETSDDAGLFAVLPPAVRGELDLPESVALRVAGDAGPGETPFALESAGVEWCIARAAGRGRLAAARLDSGAVPKPAGALRERFTALNASVRARGSRVRAVGRWVLEFRYEARGEERADGSVFVAVGAGPEPVAVSVPLADALLASLDEAAPAAVSDEDGVETLARRVEPLVRSRIRDRLAPFREAMQRRLAADRERLVAYHDTLAAEAGRRPGKDPDALRAKADAIARQRDEKLAELAERHSTQVRYALSSALHVTYEASVCDLVLRRRRREIEVCVAWDPFLHEPLPLLCAACDGPSLAFHVCDEAGHLTCATCAARCAECGRVTCRTCHGPGCRGCGST